MVLIMSMKNRKRISNKEIKFKINSVPIIYISRVFDTGEEHHMNKPRALGWFVGTHIIQTKNGKYEYHEDIYFNKHKKEPSQNTKALTFTAYLTIAGKMEKKAVGVTSYMAEG